MWTSLEVLIFLLSHRYYCNSKNIYIMCSYREREREREREINIKLFYDLPGHFCCDCHKSFALTASQLRVKDQEVRIVEGPRSRVLQ